MDMMDMRPKPWDELSADEKIERMRDQVKSAQSEIRFLREKLYKMEYHKHDANGELLIPFRNSNPGICEGMSLKGGKEYF